MKTKTITLFVIFSMQLVYGQSQLDHSAITKICDKGIYEAINMHEYYSPVEDVSSMCIPKNNGIPNSYWYSWTIDHPGTIEFTITPSIATDDIDFELYLQTESKIQMVRCMASGPNIGSSNGENCLGVTGMLEEFSKIKETLGCHPDKTNFTTPAYTSKGQTYVLKIINFSSNVGFDFNIMGTADLKGGEKLSIEHEVENQRLFHFEPKVIDRSLIDSYRWNFGIGAHPEESKSALPNPVVYESAGVKKILLETWNYERCYTQAEINIEVNKDQLYQFSDNALQSFPNPFWEEVNIGIPNYNNDEEQTISLWSINGELVFEKNVRNELEILHLPHLAAGTYLLKLNSSNKEYVTELIKVNNQGN